MSVYIKGMEMPESCMLCPFCVEEADPANGEMCMVTGNLMPPCTRERLADCPLVPVPPHGRLIDADALDDILADQSEDAYNRTHAPRSWERALSAMRDYLEDSQTIIPADQKEEQT